MYTLFTLRSLEASLILLFAALLLISNLKFDTAKDLVYHREPSDEANALDFNHSSTSTVTLPFGRYDHTHKSPSLHLLPRAGIPPLDYETARCKGEKLYSMVKAAYSKQTTSPINISSIGDAWDREDYFGGLDFTWNDFFKQHFEGRLPDNSELLRIELSLDRPYKNSKGEQLDEDEIAGGFYNIVYVPSFSTILVIDMESPKGHLLDLRDGDISEEEIQRRIPPLNRFSDVMWAVWNTVSKTPHDLRYLCHDAVTNKDTTGIMKQVFNNGPAKTLVRWPGLTFGLDQEEGQALLGTPNGLGTAWLLIDRAKELGPRMPRVTIFSPFPQIRSSYRMVWDMRPVGAT